uniref:glycerophosphodiester phosphodiesterase n=1 Tax=Candidatus Ventrenecus sp. TaxID=3085654 RepID=UPI003FEDBAEF
MNHLIAHRGLKKEASENTLEAFEKSINNTFYSGFECDVRTTKDHIFVICHNPIYKGKIISLTNYKEFKKDNLPTLENVLKLKTNKIMILEIKEINCDINRLSIILQKYDYQNIYVMSFYNKIINNLSLKNLKIKVGVLNYVLNSENDYQNYDFICLLESIMTSNLESYFTCQNKEVFIYGIHNLEKLTKEYKKSYFITDVVVE